MLTNMAALAQFLATDGIEGMMLQSYDDATGEILKPDEEPEGEASIGVGLIKYADGKSVEPGDELTLQEAWDETYHYLNQVLAPSFARIFTANLTEFQAMALASWLYNFGESKARRYSLPKLINSGASEREIIDKWMEYINSGGEPELGLYRRRMAEVLAYKDLDWRAALNVTWRDDVYDVIEELGGTVEGEPDADLFDEDTITDPTPDSPVTTEDANAMQLEALKTGKKISFTELSRKVPVEAVEYLEDEDKTPGNITVKRMEDSQRGKGFAKQEQGKQQIIVGAGGSAAVAIGAAEPVVSFVEKYSVNTIAIVFLVLTVIGIVTFYWGKYQRQKGEDAAEDLLG